MCGLEPEPHQPVLSLLYYRPWKTKPNLNCLDLALRNIYSILLLSMSVFFFLCVYSPNATGSVETLDEQTETESVVSFRRERPRHRETLEQHGENSLHLPGHVEMLISSKHAGVRNLTPE